MLRDASFPLTFRAASRRESDRSVEAVIASESRVSVLDRETWTVIDEILLAQGARLSDQLPLLADHDRALDSLVGSVRELRRDGSRIVGRLYFARDDELADRLWRLTADGHVDAVSVGYRVDSAVTIRPGESRTVNGRTYQADGLTLRVSTAWTPKEVSLVTIPADTAARIRTSPLFLEIPMHTTTTLQARSLSPEVRRQSDRMLEALAPELRERGVSMRWPEVAAICLRSQGSALPENDVSVIRAALSGPSIPDAFGALFGSAVLRGFESEPDTTVGWTREVPAASFLPFELLTLSQAARLEKLARGGTAVHAEYGLLSSTIRLGRYAGQFVAEEQDLVDDTVGATLLAAEQLGQAARRVRADLTYSLILANPTLDTDSIAIFDAATHGNYGSGGGSAMGTAGLGTAIAAIGNQVYRDADNQPIHVNREAAVLVVPPDLSEVARRTVRNLVLGDGHDIEVRSESRLGTAGVVDPDGGDTQTGTATNWLLAARASASPSIVVAGLNGSLLPSVRSFQLSQGEWGLGWDVCLDVAVKAVDYRGLYFSAGA
jgi:phage head maturation protease